VITVSTNLKSLALLAGGDIIGEFVVPVTAWLTMVIIPTVIKPLANAIAK